MSRMNYLPPLRHRLRIVNRRMELQRLTLKVEPVLLKSPVQAARYSEIKFLVFLQDFILLPWRITTVVSGRRYSKLKHLKLRKFSSPRDQISAARSLQLRLQVLQHLGAVITNINGPQRTATSSAEHNRFQ